VSLKAELNGTRHNTKPTPRRGSARADVKSGAEEHSAQWEAYAEERGSARGLRRGAGKCKRLTPRSGEVQEAHAEERGSARGLRRGAGKCKRLTPRSGEVQEAYAEERGSARGLRRGAGKCKRLTPRSGEVQEMTLRSVGVQEADDEEWGSATATGGETGECKNAIERGKWGHPSSRHSCDGPAPRSSMRARRVGPPEQPT
jgi:hypothetical protein